MFLFKPADKTGPLRKFARPYHGPFRVIEMDANTAKIRRVDRPGEDSILVAVDRLRHCPSEVSSAFWPPAKQCGKKKEGVTNPLLTRDVLPTDLDTDTPPSEGSDGSGPRVNTMDTDQEAVLSQQDGDGDSSSRTSKMKKRGRPHKQEDWPEQAVSKCSEKMPFSGGPTETTNVTVEDQDLTRPTAEPVETKGGKWAHRLRKNPKKYSPEDG